MFTNFINLIKELVALWPTIKSILDDYQTIKPQVEALQAQVEAMKNEAASHPAVQAAQQGQ